ncbi:MAG TPA: hypothetical protein VEN29_07470 [Casimicrobiaceae bacterium]|nr:hypothetical protein [Casimicrobiaceae bacterium]
MARSASIGSPIVTRPISSLFAGLRYLDDRGAVGFDEVAVDEVLGLTFRTSRT